MRMNGRDALSSLENAIFGARNNEGRLTQVLSSAAAEAERLRHDLAESFKALALVRLDALMRNQVIGQLDAAERRALDLMRSHKSNLDQILIRCGGAQSAVAKAEEVHRAATAVVAAAREPIAEMQARVEAEMKSDAAWVAQKAAVERAVEVAKAAEEKAATSEADREEKRKPYEADPLFMYLWKAGYGTPSYAAGPFVRYLDRKVAGLIGYDRARPNYTLLNEIPARLRDHALGLVTQMQAQDAALEQIEREALARAGMEPLVTVLQRALADLKGANEALTKAHQSLADLDGERLRLQSDGDRRAHDDALGVLTQAIAQESLQTMYQEARQTPTAEDDRLVQRIETTRDAIAKAEAEVARIREEARETARRRGELETVRDRMRQRRYDRPNSQFEIDGGDVLAGLIGGILGGALQSRDLWDALEKAHRKRRDWDDDDDDDDDHDDDGDDPAGPMTGPWGSRRHHPTFRFPSSSVPRFPSGMGGGFRTGGGFKGGGFKTGGRF